METDILDSLNDLGYEGPLTDETAFMKALDGGPKSLEFTKLVHILAEEIKRLCNLEETVNVMDDPEESVSFLLELSSFLKELGCPYKKLVTGHMSSRLQTKEDRLLLLDYLVSELMAARMVNIDRPKEKQGSGMEIIVQESPTAKDLKEILISLKFNKPPPNITAEMLFSKLESKLRDTLQKEGDQLVGKPLYNKALSEKEWKQLEINFTEMFEEYRLRRETLITRLECTIQSFEWSDRLKTKKDHIQSTYRPKREQLKVKPNVKLSDFLAARTDLLQVEKTSSATVRKNTQSEVNKVIIGQVPDRGGRPNEQQPPPPEMPSWQQQRAPQGPGGDTRVEQPVPKMKNRTEEKLRVLAEMEQARDMSNKINTTVGAITPEMFECNDKKSNIVELSNGVKNIVDTESSVSVTVKFLPVNKGIAELSDDPAESIECEEIINVESSEVNTAELIEDSGSSAEEISETAGVKRHNAASFFKDVSGPHRDGQSNQNVKAPVGVPLSKNKNRNRRIRRKQRWLMNMQKANMNLSGEGSSIAASSKSGERGNDGTKENPESTTETNRVVAEINNILTKIAHSTGGTKRLRKETQSSEVSESSTSTTAKLPRYSEEIRHSSKQDNLEIEPNILESMNGKGLSGSNDNQQIIKIVIMPEGYPKTTFECKMLATIQLLIWTKLEQTSDPLPHISLEGILGGALHIRCIGQESARWFIKNYEGQIIEGMKVRVAQTISLNRVKMSWKTENICIHNVHRLLLMTQRLNPGLRTSEWKVTSTDINESSIKRIVYVDQSSANYIKAMDYKLKGGICDSYFKLLDDNVM